MNSAEKRRQQQLNKKVVKTEASEQPPVVLQTLALAVAHHQAGRRAEAEELYRQIMVLAPDQPFAPYMLGAMAHQSGNDDGAVDLLSKAIAIKPDMAEAHNALGLALRALGRADDAVASCHRALAIKTNYAEALNTLGLALRDLEQFEGAAVNLQKAVTIKPNFADAHSNLGLVLYDLGKLDESIASYRKALAINPNLEEAHSNLGNTQKDLGRRDESIACYDRALAIKSDYVEAYCQLANAFNLQGKLELAVTTYQKALAINPNFAAAHINLGLVLQDLGKLDEAIISYRKALAINPDFAEAYCILGNALRNLENLGEAVTCHRCAVSLDPQNDLFWACLAASLEFFSFTSADDNLWQDLLHLLERPTVRPASVVRSVFSALRQNPNFAQIVAEADPLAPDSGVADWDAAERLSEIPLFLRILGLCPVWDPQIERMLTVLRHSMLRETMEGGTTGMGLPFLAALALQCFINEYVFPESDEETENVENLQKKIAMLVETKCDVPPLFVAALGAYRPLYRFPWAQQLANRAWDGAIKDVIERQISEPFIEQSLRPKFPCLTTVQDTVSQSVRQQYEENPYPRWIKTDIQGNGHSIRDVLQGPLTRLDLGDYQSPDSPEILVAGCGTGAHPLNTATKFLNAKILAMDLSLSSLAYALRKTAELGISNISYAQGDIMEIGTIERRFDLIECVGVLHHLRDPQAGWRGLVDLLRPDGLMRIGLYSELARQSVVEGRTLIAEKGYTASPEDIRRCRQDIISMAEAGDLTMAKLCNFGDFFSLSNCRDLLFHVQEHRFTLPQIEEALKALDLGFLGFEVRNQSTLRNFKTFSPQEHGLTSLSKWHAFECTHPDTFGGMYIFWCRKL